MYDIAMRQGIQPTADLIWLKGKKNVYIISISANQVICEQLINNGTWKWGQFKAILHCPSTISGVSRCATLKKTNSVLNFNKIKFTELNVDIPGGKFQFEFSISIYNSDLKTRKTMI